MSCITIFLIILAPLLALGYAIGEHFGLWDQLSGREFAMEGLERLRSAGGYPKSWIYDDDQDKQIFDALERRISKRTKEAKIKKALTGGQKPSLITIGGAPISLMGVPDEWQEENKRVYLSNLRLCTFLGCNVIQMGQAMEKVTKCVLLLIWKNCYKRKKTQGSSILVLW